MNESDERQFLTLVTDPLELESALRLLSLATDEQRQISRRWLEKHKFVAVPVASGLHFDQRDIDALVKAMHTIECSQFYAVLNELSENLALCYRVEASPEGLSAFNRCCGQFNYFLIPQNESFAVDCRNTGDYFVVAGIRSFVEIAIGKTIEEARKEFFLFASDEELWTPEERAFRMSVAEKYTDVNAVNFLDYGESD
jgi:hypothetical protein